MCGIVGLLEQGGSGADALATLRGMRDAMEARGPDDAGEAIMSDGRVLLGHRRLAIIELSALGHQPMRSPDGRLTIVYNGEIYNHLELRPELERAGWAFRSGSDTETILAAYQMLGTAAFARLRGMFGIAIWDSAAGELVLARDPHGIKPLYYRRSPGFAFASQVTALLADPRTDRRLDPAGVAGFAVWGSVPEPNTIVAGISALPAGHFMTVGLASGQPHEPQAYSTIDTLFRRSREKPSSDPRDAIRESVREHMLADTEVGCFLSAGVDSGAILGMMRDCEPARLRAITLRFAEFAGTERDESGLAAEVAALYGAEHTIDTIDRADFEASLPAILSAMDQPSIDGINSWFVSRSAARMGLKVALSGLGGDELLGGYSTFRTIPATRRMMLLAKGAGPLGAAARALLRRVGPGKLRHVLDLEPGWAGAYLARRAMALPETAAGVVGPRFAPAFGNASDPLAAVRAHTGDPDDSDVARVSQLESSLYMRNQLLRDSDWAGMAHSLEIRLPLVDAVLTRQIARHLPDFVGGRGKALLAGAPYVPLPAAIVDRRKTGFGIPVAQWTGGGAEAKLASGWARQVLESYADRYRLSF